MARIARVVCPEIPHHVTQRGNHHADIFRSDDDRMTYIKLLKYRADLAGLAIWGWCLMTNHVHLIVVPQQDNSLSLALGGAHNQYARYRNVRDSTTGHVFQARFYSCALDRKHVWAALRYVERNPVRAGFQASAEGWRWSSARAHYFGDDEFGLLETVVWRDAFGTTEWSAYLRAADEVDTDKRIRQCTRTGRPLGDEAFVADIGLRLGRDLTVKRPGPKPQAHKLEPGQIALEIGG